MRLHLLFKKSKSYIKRPALLWKLLLATMYANIIMELFKYLDNKYNLEKVKKGFHSNFILGASWSNLLC